MLQNTKEWQQNHKKQYQELMRRKYYKRREKLLKGKSCVKCGISDWRILTFDHILSISNGGETTKDNLQILCWNCHRIKSIENRDWKQSKRKIKTMSFNANYGDEKLKEFL